MPGFARPSRRANPCPDWLSNVFIVKNHHTFPRRPKKGNSKVACSPVSGRLAQSALAAPGIHCGSGAVRCPTSLSAPLFDWIRPLGRYSPVVDRNTVTRRASKCVTTRQDDDLSSRKTVAPRRQTLAPNISCVRTVAPGVPCCLRS